jgi:hypothetical protein
MTRMVGEGSPEARSRPGSLTLDLPGLWRFVAVGLPAVALLLPPLSTIDLAYQVRAGDLMLATRHLLGVDVFTFTAGGHPWLNQQWGAELVFALLHRAGGWALLIVVRAALGGVIAWFLYLSCRSRGAGVKRAAALTIAGMALAFPGMILRPQLLGLALFAATVWLAGDRSRRPRSVWIVPVLVIPWANLHGSFVLAPVILGLAALEDVHLRSPSAGRTALAAAAAALAATANPFGLRVWSYALGITTNSQVTDSIVEWRPPTIRTGVGALFFLSAAAVLLMLARRGARTPWPQLVTLALFFAIGLFAVRGVYWWALVVPPVVAQLLWPEGRRAAGTDLPAANMAVAALLVVLGVAFLPWWRSGGSANATRLLADAPQGVTRALRGALGPGDRPFNPQIWGSWLEFSFPDHRWFVDARIEVFPVPVWRDYDRVSGGIEGWQAILHRWGVTVVVVDRRQQAALIPRILRDPGWRLVYEDAEGLVFTAA